MRGGVQGHQQEEGGEDEALRGRTRVVRGGREAMKASRKEAKKRAKDDFRRTQEAAAAQERRQKLKNEVCIRLCGDTCTQEYSTGSFTILVNTTSRFVPMRNLQS